MSHGRVLIVGGGLSGSELAWGLARAGLPTLLITTSLDTIANLPGDGWRFEAPAGGLLELVAREARGDDGAWRSRALHRAVKRELERTPALHVLQSNVTGLIVEDGRVRGVRTWEGVDRAGARVALCVGTFMRARLELGTLREHAGRLSEMAYDDLHDDLAARGVVFTLAEVGLAGDATAPGYTVRYGVVAPGELGPDGALVRLPGAWCFGACAKAPASMAAAAHDGAAAAAAWRGGVVG